MEKTKQSDGGGDNNNMEKKKKRKRAPLPSKAERKALKKAKKATRLDGRRNNNMRRLNKEEKAARRERKRAVPRPLVRVGGIVAARWSRRDEGEEEAEVVGIKRAKAEKRGSWFVYRVTLRGVERRTRLAHLGNFRVVRRKPLKVQHPLTQGREAKVWLAEALEAWPGPPAPIELWPGGLVVPTADPALSKAENKKRLLRRFKGLPQSKHLTKLRAAVSRREFKEVFVKDKKPPKPPQPPKTSEKKPKKRRKTHDKPKYLGRERRRLAATEGSAPPSTKWTKRQKGPFQPPSSSSTDDERGKSRPPPPPKRKRAAS